MSEIFSVTSDQIATSQAKAKLDVTAERIVRDWRADLDANPISKFEFSGHTPPFADLDLELLSPANSRRQTAVSIYADIDGFTRFVGDHVADDYSAKDVVRVLHVLRSEPWIPLATLLAVDHSSPYYNEKSHAGMFYAESWALVHMLNLDPAYRPQLKTLVAA